MTLNEMKNRLEHILSPKRFKHSINVMNCAVELAKIYGQDECRAAVAGLLHDCARDIKGGRVFELCGKYNIDVDNITCSQPELLHGPIGSRLAEDEYGVTDEAVLKAICCHTTGCSNMSVLDKIVFVSDYIEPGRCFPGVEDVRKLAVTDMDGAVLMSLDKTIKYVLSKGALLHTDTVNARNYIIADRLERQHCLGGV